jgi:hypothetical protein
MRTKLRSFSTGLAKPLRDDAQKAQQLKNKRVSQAL